MHQPCRYEKCHRLDLRPLLEAFRCSLCERMFCLSHRNPEDHCCHVLSCKEECRLTVVQQHEELIKKLSNGSNHRRMSEGEEKSEDINLLNKTKINPALERIKIRMKCIGIDSVPSYDRHHVRIMLKEDITRGDITLKVSILPSQKTAKKPGPSRVVTAKSDLFVWLDKTKSIGWTVDFLTRHFKLTSVDNLKPNLCLGREQDQDTIIRFPYDVSVADVVVDGDSNLCLIKK